MSAAKHRERRVNKIIKKYGLNPIECIPDQYRPTNISGEFVSRMEAILKHVPTLQLFQTLVKNTVELRLADKLDDSSSFKFATSKDLDRIKLSFSESNPAKFDKNKALKGAKQRQHHHEKAEEPSNGAEEESSGSQSVSREAAHSATHRQSSEGGGDGYRASSRKIDEDYDDEEDDEEDKGWMPEELKGVSAANMQALLHDGNVEGLLK